MGSAFGQYGMDNRMPTDQFLNLPKGDRRQMQVEGLQKFSEAMNLIGAQQSGDSQKIALAQNKIRQRQLDEEDAKKKAEQDKLIASMTPEQKKIYELYGPKAAFDYKYNKPKPEKRDSYVAKDGYRYFVDDGTRMFPNITVKEEQSEADIYKENAARIKNIVLNEGIDSSKLTTEEKDYYINNINKQGVLSLDQALASIIVGDSGNPNQKNNKTYRVINQAYSGTPVDELVKQAQDLNPSYTKEQAINELISNGIIAE